MKAWERGAQGSALISSTPKDTKIRTPLLKAKQRIVIGGKVFQRSVWRSRN